VAVNLGQISGGAGANIVADSCRLNASRRLIPKEIVNEELERIKKIVTSADSEANLIATFTGEPYLADKTSLFANELFSLSKKFLGQAKFDVKMSWTEATLFSR